MPLSQAAAAWTLMTLLLALVVVALWCRRRHDRFAAAVTEGEQQKRRRQVCILMFSTPDIVDAYAGIAAEINEAYAKRHGYAFLHVVQPKQHAIPQWEKVRLIREHLPGYDAVFWIDSDAVFNRQEVSLDRWLAGPAHFVGCTDVPNGPYKINCGTMLVKNTTWANQFVDIWWSLNWLPKYNRWANEQEALHDMLHANVNGCRDRVKIEAVDAFNSSYPDLASGRRDTFVLHFMAMSAEVRRRELLAVRSRLLGGA